MVGIVAALVVLVVITVAVGSQGGQSPSKTATTATTPTPKATPAATQPAVGSPFDGKAYAKKIEKAFVAVNGRSIKQSCNFAEPTWHCYYAGIKAESESWVTMTLAFDGGVSEHQARDMAKRASLAFFNFVGDDFKKLDTIVVYDSTGLDIGTTYRRDVPLLNK